MIHFTKQTMLSTIALAGLLVGCQSAPVQSSLTDNIEGRWALTAALDANQKPIEALLDSEQSAFLLVSKNKDATPESYGHLRIMAGCDNANGGFALHDTTLEFTSGPKAPILCQSDIESSLESMLIGKSQLAFGQNGHTLTQTTTDGSVLTWQRHQ